jgi:hypothetical protein
LLISKNRDVITQESLVKIVRLTPLKRLNQIRVISPHVQVLVDQLVREYSWFLEKTGLPNEEVINWISNRGARTDAFNHGAKFSQAMYELLMLVTADTDTMRYLVI